MLLRELFSRGEPGGIAVAASGSVYVTDTLTDEVLKLSADGSPEKRWGTGGTGKGQFSEPAGITVNAQGDVFVVDTGNNRIQQFDENGVFLRKWGT